MKRSTHLRDLDIIRRPKEMLTCGGIILGPEVNGRERSLHDSLRLRRDSVLLDPERVSNVEALISHPSV